jgi:methyltransferase (TIGR00027 family)
MVSTEVGWTALLTAYGRAQESAAADPLFSDPFAADFVAQAADVKLNARQPLPRLGPARDDDSSTLWTSFRFYFAQRTPFYDRKVIQAVDDGIRQVVILGAGLDSRAYRLGLPTDLRLFEIDQAAVLKFKAEVLDRRHARPTCQRIPLIADVTGGLAEPLQASGFDPSKPTLWVAEGLLMYLTRHTADRLLADVTGLSAPNSRIVSEYFIRRWTNNDVGYAALSDQDKTAWDLLMEAFRYGPDDTSPTDWLAAQGWTTNHLTTVVEEGRAAHRVIPADFSRHGANNIWLFAGNRPPR